MKLEYGNGLSVVYGNDEVIVKVDMKELENESHYLKVTYLNFLRDKLGVKNKFFTIEPKEAQDLLEEYRNEKYLYETVKSNGLGMGFVRMHRTMVKSLDLNSQNLDESDVLRTIKTFEKYAKFWNSPTGEIPHFYVNGLEINAKNLNFFNNNKESGLSKEILTKVKEFYIKESIQNGTVKNKKYLEEMYFFDNQLKQNVLDNKTGEFISAKKNKDEMWHTFCQVVSSSEVASTMDELVEFEIKKNKINEFIYEQELKMSVPVRKRLKL